MTAVLAFAASILNLIQTLAAAGQAVEEAATWGAGLVKSLISENRDPTDAEWDDLNNRIKTIHDQIAADAS